MNPLTGQQLIDRFNLLIDQQSDLSDTETLRLAQESINEILSERPWMFLVKSETGVLTVGDTEFDLPTDFKELESNAEDNQKILYVGDNASKYLFIDRFRRKDYLDTRGYAFIDYRTLKLVVTKSEESEKGYEFDYIYNPEPITFETSPVIPSNYHEMIVKLMAYKWASIDQTQRNFSYAQENRVAYENDLSSMQIEDARKREIWL